MAAIAQAGDIYYLPSAKSFPEDELKSLSINKAILGHPCIILSPGTEKTPTKIALVTSLGGKSFTCWAVQDPHLASYRVPIGPLASRNPHNPHLLELDNPTIFHKPSYVETHETFLLPYAISTKLEYRPSKLVDRSFSDLLSEISWAQANSLSMGEPVLKRRPSIRRASMPELSVAERLKRTYKQRATQSEMDLTAMTQPTTANAPSSTYNNESRDCNGGEQQTANAAQITTTTLSEVEKIRPTERISLGPPMASMFVCSKKPGHVTRASI